MRERFITEVIKPGRIFRVTDRRLNSKATIHTFPETKPNDLKKLPDVIESLQTAVDQQNLTITLPEVKTPVSILFNPVHVHETLPATAIITKGVPIEQIAYILGFDPQTIHSQLAGITQQLIKLGFPVSLDTNNTKFGLDPKAGLVALVSQPIRAIEEHFRPTIVISHTRLLSLQVA